MKRFGPVPYLVFALAYSMSGVLLSAMLDSLPIPRAVAIVAGWITALIAAFASVLLARRFGRLGYSGLLVTTTMIFAASMIAIIAILCAIATTGGIDTSPAHVISGLDWNVVAQSFAQTVGLPLLAMLVIRKVCTFA